MSNPPRLPLLLAPFARAELWSLVLFALARPAAAEPCVPRVELEGEALVVGKVGDELARLGVERGVAAPGCRGVLARVEADGEGIAVAIKDGARRSEGRVVSDPSIAASWIDSWLHDDLDGRAWLITAPVILSSSTPVITKTLLDKPVQPGLFDRAHLTVGWEHVWTDDSASADGLGIAGCMRVGALCVGGRARYVREAERTVEQTAMQRREMSLLATVSLPINAGRMSIAPELGLGVGRTSTRRIEGCTVYPAINMPPGCDPMDPSCPPQPQPPTPCMESAGKMFVGDNFATATISPRLAAGIRIAVPLFEHVWLDGLASIAVSPASHTEAFAATAATVGPDGTVMQAPSPFSLPGEATFGMWLGVGLRVGAP